MNHASATPVGLYDPARDHSDCGVGFLTRLDGTPSHDVILKGDEALRAIPHRGGTSAEGVGDGAGVSVDLSVEFFGALTGEELRAGHFGVANCFVPTDPDRRAHAVGLVGRCVAEQGFETLLVRDVPVDHSVARPAAEQYQLPIVQWVFRAPEEWSREDVDAAAHRALLAVEAVAYADDTHAGLYPLSLSARTQVLKGRLNSGELVRYFRDLTDPRHSVRSLYFHTRFSTNTEPHPTMAQPFRLMAHNGELNTDRKNRLSDEALARARTRSIVRPPGQSDSSRLDQTLQSRVFDDGLDLVEAVVSLMPPAWENDRTLPAPVRDMLEYFSLYEEKNDGPAALIFSDGDVVGARLDRLGLRPLRTVETAEYLMVASEAGQVAFPDDKVVRRGRIEAGGMLVVDHRAGRVLRTRDVLDALAARRPYGELLDAARVHLDDLPAPDYYRGTTTLGYDGDLSLAGRYVAYALNQESFRFMLDPMLATGSERISAMGYGNAINALSDTEGGMAKYFSQRFAQVTNPPLDSIREADGMSMRVALGPKPDGTHATNGRQLVVSSPVLGHLDMVRLRDQRIVPLERFAMLYEPVAGDETANADALRTALHRLCDDVERFAAEQGGIALLTDRAVSSTRAPLPVILAVAAVNQRLIETGLRLRVSLVVESGQLASSHHVATALGFGASAVYSLSARLRAEEKFPSAAAPAGEITETDRALAKFRKAAEKSLAKTMGRVGLCTAESYIGGEFFEPNYLDTRDDVFAQAFPHMEAPVGGVGFARIAQAATDWHERARTVETEQQIPLLGLFKERSDGAGHSFGVTAVRGFGDMVEERPEFGKPDDSDALRLLTLGQLDDAFGITDAAYRNTGYDALSEAEIDAFRITPGYRAFLRTTHEERSRRPAALRDVLALPADVTGLRTAEDFARELGRFSTDGNASVTVRGMAVTVTADGVHLRLTAPGPEAAERHAALADGLARLGDVRTVAADAEGVLVTASGTAARLLALLDSAPDSVPLDEVQPAHEITRSLASGAMSHGALVATAHEAVAHGTNMVGALSNSGEGGEHHTRYGTIRGSRIKQFASGRFGIWAGYLADPMLQELEIKIGQGAKPGEGGQLPAPKVTVDIAAARGGTPGIELISPPPHHDTYSIEDLAQLIHDCKAARVRVIVKLVSSEGIGTIAVGVAKAGADVINVAGNTGGTGAAAVTSLKYAGRSAEIGVAEVHQALVANGLRQKVVLRCSGAHQTGGDVVRSALLGGDSFEFGTTALMMLGCVMAKNCNVKCPAGLTTNPEVFEGDPRALAQYLLNIAHDVRQILARLGLRSLREARGRTDLLQLLDHPASVGRLDVRRLLARVPEKIVEHPEYLEKDFTTDDALIERVREALLDRREPSLLVEGVRLGNSDKSVGGQLGIDVERLLNHEFEGAVPAVTTDDRGRRRLVDDAVRIRTTGSAGQSYGVFCNDGITLEHTGTANDGVGKSQSGGRIVVRAPGGGSTERGGNVLVGNFALFGATGGRTFVQGEAGDRFAVRNSGATAVVEGVGDFGCEYMTGGTVLNLGGFGKGLGNGMSGGFLYQYDPSGELPGRVSADSLLVFPVTDTAHGAFHEEAVRLLLTWHVEATGSPLAARLLENWPSEREHVYCGMPRALLLYQDAGEILAAATRNELLDELATSIATDKLRAFKVDYRDRRTVLGGRAPAFGDQGSDDMFSLLSSYTVLGVAQDLALQRVPGASGPDDPKVTEAVRNLILTEDFFVKQRVVKYLRGTLDRFDDGELATLIAILRLDDYKRALKQRNNLSVDAPGTYGWIVHQTTKNAGRVRAARFDELLANAALDDLAARLAPQAPTETVTA
ncbi:glutamate synthase-related protein [Streptomyces caniscabiei]|uniref:Glutamate synthase large subunit n=1 Tax=Streptomyces caniscabiei TaxID=2746961 RepID=A0A927L1S8_9ACTN|nr:glutamate synthase-related protein [Streptomyces caniscabiei]MBD9724396.1 glutamate synthase large subunit [Streptomyces caniscabiei]MDX3507804.1 glutamate synthase-related protein [Streptomyces caniscabiei]MDX3717766.1 glutamate synthase-related protein [Streptomyces caniscabiei]WEO25503.1 glutamate synthase-related protein [Streptomyces caniscabiei]